MRSALCSAEIVSYRLPIASVCSLVDVDTVPHRFESSRGIEQNQAPKRQVIKPIGTINQIRSRLNSQTSDD